MEVSKRLSLQHAALKRLSYALAAFTSVRTQLRDAEYYEDKYIVVWGHTYSSMRTHTGVRGHQTCTHCFNASFLWNEPRLNVISCIAQTMQYAVMSIWSCYTAPIRYTFEISRKSRVPTKLLPSDETTGHARTFCSGVCKCNKLRKI